MSEAVKDDEMIAAKKAAEACEGVGFGVEVEGEAELVQPLDQLLQGPDADQIPSNSHQESVELEAPPLLSQPPSERVSEFEASTDDAPNDPPSPCPCPSPCLTQPEENNPHSTLDQACDDKASGLPDATSVQDYLEDHNQDTVELTSRTVTNLDSSILPIAVRVHDGSEDLKTTSEEGYLGAIETDSGAGVKELYDAKHEGADVDSTKMVSLETNPEDSVKFKSQDNVDNGHNETHTGSDAKELSVMKGEGSGDNLLKENSSQIIETSDEKGKEMKCGVDEVDMTGVDEVDMTAQADIEKEQPKPKLDAHAVAIGTPHQSLPLVPYIVDGFESGTEEEQEAFRKDVESFYRRNGLEFKAPKFYKEEVNLLKLWRAVIKLGGYEQVTSFKLWRQVGESFRPPKTCTTVSWTFRIFYEKALLEYEKHKLQSGELPFSDGSLPESLRAESQAGANQALGSGRARRDAAARAMQGWHSQRLLDNGEVCHPVIKDKNLSSASKVDKQLKANGAGLLKRKKPSSDEHAVNVVAPIKMMKPPLDSMVIDIGPPADWVKINVQKTVDCFEIYALVPGLLREEVHVQSDPAGRLIISGQPEQLDNPWGITPFKKVVSLPSRIDPHHTTAVVTLHGQLFVRVPFEHSGR